MELFENLILITSFGIMLWCFYILIKITNDDKNFDKIFKAINRYAEDTKDYETAIKMIDSLEDFDDTLFRFWDWGYKKILPKEYYQLIKPYIR